MNGWAIFNRPLRGLNYQTRGRIPVMNGWAIVIRPLRRLIETSPAEIRSRHESAVRETDG